MKIKDEGVGMDAEKVASINHENGQFVKVSNGTGQEKGNGLGLILCKSFVQMMNGLMTVSSKVNGGTTFTVKLPSGKHI